MDNLNWSDEVKDVDGRYYENTGGHLPVPLYKNIEEIDLEWVFWVAMINLVFWFFYSQPWNGS